MRFGISCRNITHSIKKSCSLKIHSLSSSFTLHLSLIMTIKKTVTCCIISLSMFLMYSDCQKILNIWDFYQFSSPNNKNHFDWQIS